MSAGAPTRRLPRGSHGLTREEVVASQRLRMLEAIVATVAEKGYGATSVADVIGGAGVSRETFYEQFADKEACFLAALEVSVDLTMATIDGALGDPTDAAVDRFGRALQAYPDALAREPAAARTFLVEAYGAGPQALQLRLEQQQRFTDLISRVFGARRKADRFGCEALVAAVSSLVTVRIAAGKAHELPALHDPLMELVRSGSLLAIER